MENFIFRKISFARLFFPLCHAQALCSRLYALYLVFEILAPFAVKKKGESLDGFPLPAARLAIFYRECRIIPAFSPRS
jgi:hypothetical protein